MGFEASGTVLATGPGVEGIHVGDAIGVLPGFDTSKYGTYAEHAIIPQAYVLPQPPGLTNIQAAGLWMAYLTARSDKHKSELQSLMPTSYDVFCLKKKKQKSTRETKHRQINN